MGTGKCAEPSVQGLPDNLDSPSALRQLLRACNTLSHPIFIHDQNCRILRANEAYVRCAGMNYRQMLGKRYWQVFPRGKGPLESCKQALDDGIGEHLEEIVTEANDVFLSRALAVRDEGGRYLYSVHFLEDITQLRKAEEAFHREKALSDATIACAPGVFYVIDVNQRFIRWNGQLNRLTGLSNEEIRRTPAVSIIHPDDQTKVAETIQEVFRNGHAQVVARLITADKGVRDFSFTGQRFDVAHNTYLAGFGVDISDIKRARDRMHFMATHDRLTGLPNRNLFFDRLQHGLEKAARRRDHMAVLFVDLDNFKQVNDSLGHPKGDLLLVQVADRLRACTRKEDTIARLGGDEFTIIEEDIPAGSEDIVAHTAERVIEALAAPFYLGGREALLSASVGIAFYPRDGGDVDTLLSNADVAMYKAKEIGKNNYQFFTSEMNAHAAERRALEHDLRGALGRGELFLVYQPQVRLNAARVVGFEALLRWQHPQRGLLLPEEFIPLAEATGLILPIGDWVLRTACAQIGRWARRGLRRTRIAVNLSARQFRQENLVESIAGIVRENEIAASSLEFELTESSVMDDAEGAVGILERLKGMGLGLAIDDFGIGYSSLQYLKRFPIDNLKIDSHFIKDLATDANDQAIVSAIITMGHSLQLQVIAEGVETRHQLDFLRAKGCDLVQGDYLNRPLSAGRAAKIIGAV